MTADALEWQQTLITDQTRATELTIRENQYSMDRVQSTTKPDEDIDTQ